MSFQQLGVRSLLISPRFQSPDDIWWLIVGEYVHLSCIPYDLQPSNVTFRARFCRLPPTPFCTFKSSSLSNVYTVQLSQPSEGLEVSRKGNKCSSYCEKGYCRVRTIYSVIHIQDVHVLFHMVAKWSFNMSLKLEIWVVGKRKKRLRPR